MTKRHAIAQVFEDECDWFATLGQTMPPNNEGLEEDMGLSVAAMRPQLVSHWIRTDWRSLTAFTGMAGGRQGADDSAGNRRLDRRGEVGGGDGRSEGPSRGRGSAGVVEASSRKYGEGGGGQRREAGSKASGMSPTA